MSMVRMRQILTDACVIKSLFNALMTTKITIVVCALLKGATDPTDRVFLRFRRY